ncbi:unnamed protein product [Rhizophagus irregularis]|nr:unnamed protein product [Rhizophagus irregularis]CAB5369728.1 unnamed protein product [Rhizophagus irregularis]
MLRDVGSYNVTPWSNKESEYQFWTRSSQPEQDRATLQQLSKIGFLGFINYCRRIFLFRIGNKFECWKTYYF